MHLLKRKNLHIHVDETPHQVQAMYENSLRSTSRHDNFFVNSYLPIFGQKIFNRDIIEGGRFNSDTVNLLNEMIDGSLSLLARFFSYDRGGNHAKIPEYTMMISIFNKFSNGLKIENEYYLLKRFLRHVFNPKYTSLLTSIATLFRHSKK